MQIKGTSYTRYAYDKDSNCWMFYNAESPLHDEYVAHIVPRESHITFDSLIENDDE